MFLCFLPVWLQATICIQKYVAGFFPRSYAMIWFGFTAISPFLAFVCWYAKGKSKLAAILSMLILTVLFNMVFVYGWGYFEARSILELAVFYYWSNCFEERNIEVFYADGNNKHHPCDFTLISKTSHTNKVC